MDKQTKDRINLMNSIVENPKYKIILELGASMMSMVDSSNANKIIRLDVVKKKGINLICDLSKDKIPLKNKSIDIVMAGELVEHIYNCGHFITEVRRVLRDDGVFILSTPNICSLKDRFKVFFGKIPTQSCRFSSDDNSDYQNHVNDFNLTEIKRLLNDFGFEIVKKQTNGIFLHNTKIFPRFLTPVTFGETLIIKSKKDV